MCLSCDLICLFTSFQFNLSKTIKDLYLTHLEIAYTNEFYILTNTYASIYRMNTLYNICSTRLCTETEEPVPYWIGAKIHKRHKKTISRFIFRNHFSFLFAIFSVSLMCSSIQSMYCKNPGFVSVGLGASNSTSRPSQPGHLHTIRATCPCQTRINGLPVRPFPKAQISFCEGRGCLLKTSILKSTSLLPQRSSTKHRTSKVSCRHQGACSRSLAHPALILLQQHAAD